MYFGARFMTDQNVLFNNGALHAFLEQKKSSLNCEILAARKNQILGAGAEKFKEYLIGEYKLELPDINAAATTIKRSEEVVDLSQYAHDGITEPDYCRALKISFYTPFTGNSELFRYLPSTHQLRYPHGKISNSKIVIEVIATPDSDSDPTTTRNRFNGYLDTIKKYLDYVRQDIDPFNSSLPEIIEAKINERKDELVEHDTLVSGLGFPERE